MSDEKVFKALAKFVGYDEAKKVGNSTKFIIKYTAPNYKDPEKVIERGDWEADISEELVEKALSLSTGDLFCVHTKKNEAGFDVLVDITDAKDAPTKKESTWKGKQQTSYNSVGQAVGGAWKDALSAVPLLNIKLTANDEDMLVEILDRLAWKMALRKWEQEKKLKDIMYPKKADETTKEGAGEEKLSKAEIARRKLAEKNKAAEQPKPVAKKKAKAPEPVDEFENNDLDDEDLSDEPDVE